LGKLVKIRETELLDRAIESLNENTGLSIAIRHFNDRSDIGAIGELHTNHGTIPLAIEIKTRLTPTILNTVVHQFNQGPERGLLIANYVNPLMAERLKAMDIWFLDMAGNAYIKALPIFVFIKGNKTIDLDAPRALVRAFSPAGLKVIYALLCQPKLVNATYRDLAQKANVALGTVGLVINDLIEMEYIVDMDARGRRLKNKKKLLQRWLIAYPEQLRPKQETGRYRAVDPNWWQKTDLRNLQAYWGGEVAADKLTHYLKPETITVYAPEKQGVTLRVTHKLRKDPNGDIEILKAFWDVENEANQTGIVDPILIYADLMASGDPRNIETAQMIYDQELAEHFRED
jgi:hypothetical protein